eukprot:TRINITY_DN404_c0_g1_i1.p1 TRINITY_DN404_c0_g1~~TRINITY_DN404_c0_g1_i1.p1  ORF type:complete len:150 (+),score=6.70 TRINITY_DN404_c0_g1_i1:67-450(+)
MEARRDHTLCPDPTFYCRLSNKIMFDPVGATLLVATAIIVGTVLWTGVPAAIRWVRETRRYRRALAAYNLKETCSNDQVTYMYNRLMLSYTDEAQVALVICNYDTIRDYRKARNTWCSYTDHLSAVD